jgi:CRP-like cAMP-binding protein
MNTDANPSQNPNRDKLAEIISNHAVFKRLPPEHLAMLLDVAMFTGFKKDEVIFREGDSANRFYLILKGEVALESPIRDAKPVLIQTIGSDDVLGWSWLLPPFYWHFDARATKPTEAIFFYGTWLRETCEKNPAFGYEMMKRMAAVVVNRLQAARKELVKKSGR